MLIVASAPHRNDAFRGALAAVQMLREMGMPVEKFGTSNKETLAGLDA
jgi:hypothetical protein